MIAVILSWRGIAVDGSHEKRHGLHTGHEHADHEPDPAEAVES